MDLIIKVSRWIHYAYGSQDWEEQTEIFAEFVSFAICERKDVVRKMIAAGVEQINKG